MLTLDLCAESSEVKPGPEIGTHAGDGAAVGRVQRHREGDELAGRRLVPAVAARLVAQREQLSVERLLGLHQRVHARRVAVHVHCACAVM